VVERNPTIMIAYHFGLRALELRSLPDIQMGSIVELGGVYSFPIQGRMEASERLLRKGQR